MASSFHFDVGDTMPGPIGTTKSSAAVGFDVEDDESDAPVPGLEYLRIYFNSGAVDEKVIDDEEEVDLL